jgi:predicted pyridoxine 5'-phosphate oxidase superfamily flavin-nucleotide-binding protein
MVPGNNTVVRVNGTAILTADPDVTQSFVQGGRHPRTVAVIDVGEAYFQCAKALMRSGLWSGERTSGLPSPGDFLKEQEAGFDAESYDTGYEAYARTRMW